MTIIYECIKNDELVQIHKEVLNRAKREICFMLSTYIIKISLFVRDDK